MSTDANMQVLRRAGEQWNAGKLDGYLRMYASNVVLHGYAGVEPGLAKVQEWRPDSELEARAPAALWGGVGRKP